MESVEGLKNISEKESIRETIDSRFKQPYSDRLCEYITGMRLNNSNLADRMAEDQQVIRTKYGLPQRNIRFWTPGDYENYLKDLCNSNEVDVRPTSECGDFFDEYVTAGGVYIPESKVIGVNIDKSDSTKYFSGLATLEHETIHSLQYKYFPSMPVELQEYEAYVAGFNMDHLKQNPESIETIFTFAIGGSVNHWYKEGSEESGEKINPEWNNAQYFLKNVDGISDEQIEEYKMEKMESEKINKN